MVSFSNDCRADNFTSMTKYKEFLVDFIDILFLKQVFAVSFIAMKVLNAIKTLLSQHSVAIKYQFYSANTFVYAFQINCTKAQSSF